MNKQSLSISGVTIRFAGDSGDGVQSVGAQMGSASSISGNDIRSFSDFPAEIKAPAGTTYGVSGYQINISSNELYTAGDVVDVLVAFNPAALKVSIDNLKKCGLLIVDNDKFSAKDIAKAGYKEEDPLSLLESSFTVVKVPMSTLTIDGVKDFKLSHSVARRCKNMFALGMVLAIYDKPMSEVVKWITEKFSNEEIAGANIAALKQGNNYVDIHELLPVKYTIPKASLAPGTYTQLTGNKALMLGSLAVKDSFKNNVVVSGYPITPASEVLQLLMPYNSKEFSVVQVEDEIAAASSALGASYAGGLGITVTSGPGLDLMQEVIGLAVASELPLVIVDVQRAGPSTGMPTKTEQTDLLASIYGRHGSSELPVIAPRTPAECYDAMLEASRVAIKYMTPVIVLSEAVLANGSQPVRIDELKKISLEVPALFENRNSETMAPNWLYPGRTNECRTIGGLEKDYETGYISYDPHNHQKMTDVRAKKLSLLAEESCYDKPMSVEANVSIISWGASFGAVQNACERLDDYGSDDVEHISLSQVYPIPSSLISHLNRKKSVIIVEQNTGQLFTLLSSYISVNKLRRINSVTGVPFKVESLTLKLMDTLAEINELALEKC